MSGVNAAAGAHTTSLAEFLDLARDHRVVPVTRKVLADSETPLSAYRKLAGDRPGTFLLESAENGRSWSRWSFIGAGAPSALTVVDGQPTTPSNADFDASLRSRDASWGLRDVAELDAFAGAAGLTRVALDDMPANNFYGVWEKK